MKCPLCTTDLQMTERQGVEIDFCPQCRGVWLDRGELDKILARAGSPERAEDHYRRVDEDDDDYRPARRRKSFWHELFD